MNGETQMKEELKVSARRHAKRLIDKMNQLAEVPAVVQDSIRTEMEYATLDGYRITRRNGEQNNDQDWNR